ncbi:MAG: hypothetical protein ACK4S6_01725 [Roseateles asaccharophilus]|uniref:Peptidase MA superfamily protein n=1 Tax=Roseateles asaccharophilus TaxID=582607 RepID=A0A4R6MYQ1_9BURK|nr:hypothetical protein [Roseateles asaccharophilus]MDN3545384.1 hypothetical protein [Roseateles asaccharophilus]TDP07764.1 hypothetical protein DFR39_10624 [Roseateles asaccharophilus]
MNYPQLGKQVFLYPEVPDAPGDQRADIEELLASAHERIQSIYGQPRSRPRMLITSSASSAARWGANETASMHRLPGRSCIVIGPKGLNVDVIAHEWLHAEIQQRVGYLRHLMEIPVWFDEGAALTVDYRPPFLPQNISLSAIEVQDVKSLRSGSAFFSGDVRKNYQAARLAVQPLISPERLYSELERIGAGDSFESVFPNAIRPLRSSSGRQPH